MLNALKQAVKNMTGRGPVFLLIHAIYRMAWQFLNAPFIPLPQQPAPPLQGPFVVAGVLRAASGIGESARLTIAALQKLGQDVYVYDASDVFNQAEIPSDPSWRNAAPWPQGGTLILHMNALEIPRLLLHLGAERTQGMRLVGAWAWELPRAPQNWVEHARYVHEVWACSRYVAEALSDIKTIPVKAVLIPVQPPAAISGRSFDIPAGTFTVLAMANAHSSLERKNPFGAIAAFRQAFGDAPDKLLILHISRLASVPGAEARLNQAIGNARNIRVIQEALTTPDRFALMNAADVIVSLHRAEGFGLVMAEAMMLGKPVIATRWSANMDFMDDDCAALVDAQMIALKDDANIYTGENLCWADPDIDEAAAWLKKLQAAPQLREAMGAKAKAQALRLFSPQHFRQQAGL